MSTARGLVASMFVFAAVVVAPAFNQSVFAQKKDELKRATVTDHSVSADGVQIAITYYSSTLGPDAPVVIMLHMKGSNRLVWKTNGMAKSLQSYGYAVVTVDLRKHGESKVGGVAAAAGNRKGAGLRVGDYKAMVAADLEAVKKFILEEHHKKNLNIRKTAIIAAEMSAPVAAVFAWRDWLKTPYPDAPTLEARTPRGQDIRALVLLSPSESVLGLNSGTAYYQLGKPAFGVAVLVGYGKGDIVDRGGKKTQSVYKRISWGPRSASRMYLKDYPTKLRGTDMLGRGLALEKNIINFLNLHLKKLPDPWADRHSRLGLGK